MSLKEEIRALKEKEATLAAELGNLKKTFLESEISRDMYDQIEVLQEKLKITGEAIEEKQQALYQDLQAKISRDYAGLPTLKEEYTTLVNEYSADAGTLVKKAIQILASVGRPYQNELYSRLDRTVGDISRRFSSDNDSFTGAFNKRQTLELSDLEGMAAEIKRIEGLVPGSDEALEYIDSELENLEVQDA